jgi:hypothetical protein
LGYAAGALGAQDVIAVCAPGIAADPDLADFATVTIGPGDSWRHQLGALLGRMGFTPAEVVATRS